jgi:cytochrome P450
MKTYPYFPQPAESKISSFMTLFKKKRSWLDGLYAKSYTMKMGEVRMPYTTLYIVNQPDLVQRVLVSEVKKFPKNPLLHGVLTPLLGDSIFTTNGRIWRRQRDLLDPSFMKKSVQNLFPMMEEVADDMVERLDQMAEIGGYHNLDEEMTFVTADTIFRTILSKKLTEEEGKRVLDAFVVFQEMSARIGMQSLFKVPDIFRRKTLKTYQEAGETIRETLAAVIRPRYEEAHGESEVSHRDILSSLLTAIDEDTGEPFSFKEILDQISMLFLAGHETTASSMTWTLYLLSLYPEFQEKAYAEIKEAVGDSDFTLESLKNLKLTTNIFKEALRLYPPVSFFARVAAEDTEMRDKKIKAGSFVVVSPWLMHRNERYWKDPHMFDPHRFDDPKQIEKYTYFPFGMGPRICIGAGFAMQEAVLLLATIIRRYRLELEPGFVPDIAGRLTTRSVNGMNIRLTRR